LKQAVGLGKGSLTSSASGPMPGWRRRRVRG